LALENGVYKALNTEVAVIGAGPAGLSAAIEAARAGAEVVLIDENAKPGGQLFKQIHKFFGSKVHGAGVRGIDIGKQLLQETKENRVKVRLNCAVWGLFEDKVLGLINQDKLESIQAKKIILATGVSENAVSFPGWTLPGIMGAGAAQTMINIHRVLPGNKIIMLGSGNVGLIVSYQLLQAGAQVLAVVEAAPEIGGYGVHASKIRRAGVPVITSHTIKEATGKDQVEAATIAAVDREWNLVPGTEKTLEVDTICVAAGLTPLAGLAWMAGCECVYLPELGGYVPIHNEKMESSVRGVYVAGDLAGVEEASTAMEEGRLAGLSVAEEMGYVEECEAEKRREEITERLKALRMGPFGEQRDKAKQKLVQEWQKKLGQR